MRRKILPASVLAGVLVAGLSVVGADASCPASRCSSAEYRPNSRAIVYKINPKSYRVTEQFRVRDHVGGVVRDRRTGLVHGVSWGSRTLLEWTASGKQLAAEPNQSHLLDLKDDNRILHEIPFPSYSAAGYWFTSRRSVDKRTSGTEPTLCMV